MISGEGKKYSRSTFYGAIAVLVALLLIATSFAALYYGKYEGSLSNYNELVKQSQNTQNSLQQLNSTYDSLLKYYNKALSLLAVSASQLNTSSQAYADLSKQLPALWQAYQKFYGSFAALPTANIYISFGNGTNYWYNITYQPGWNLYVATLVAVKGNLSAVYYPSYAEHFVTGIDGIENNQNMSWFLWTYNGTWQIASVGADDIIVSAGSSYAWTFCTYNAATYQPNCTP